MPVSCENPLQKGVVTVEPAFQGHYLTLDLLLDLCIVSCIVDGANNAWYKYPSAIEVPMQNVAR